MKEVDLCSYWPPILREIKEFIEFARIEEPELLLIFEEIERTVRNMYIETADESGLEKFEKYIGITLSGKESLEMRRGKVQAWWFMLLPYTWRKFLEKLTAICGENFTAKQYPDNYLVEIETCLEVPGQIEELEKVIEAMLPCNMVLSAHNRISSTIEGQVWVTTGICATESFYLTNDTTKNITINGAASTGIGILTATELTITDNMEETATINGNNTFYSGFVTAETIYIEK